MDQKLPLADELAAVFARMYGLLLSEKTVHSALQLLCSLAKDTIATAIGSGVTLADPSGRKTTTAASDPIVERADALQYELEQGPCLDAWRERTVVRIDDLSTDQRWPQWAAAAGQLGLAAVLSVPLLAGAESLGALKVYSRARDAFDERDQQRLTMCAAQAAILLSNVRTAEQTKQLSHGLTDTMRSRDLINIAKGILMSEQHVDEQTAFGVLVSRARVQHRTVEEIASALVTSTAGRGH